MLNVCGEEIGIAVCLKIADKPSKGIAALFSSGSGLSVDVPAVCGIQVNGFFYGIDIFR